MKSSENPFPSVAHWEAVEEGQLDFMPTPHKSEASGIAPWWRFAKALTLSGVGLYGAGRFLEGKLPDAITHKMRNTGKIMVGAGVPLGLFVAVGAIHLDTDQSPNYSDTQNTDSTEYMNEISVRDGY